MTLWPLRGTYNEDNYLSVKKLLLGEQRQGTDASA